jgi:hypothetical protein
VLTFVEVTMLKTLQEEHARLLEAFAGSPVNIYGQDPSLVITWVGGSLFGKGAAEMLGKSDRDLFVPEDVASLDSVKHAVLATGVAQRQRARALGERRLYDIYVRPARDGAGRVCGLACVAVELPESDRLP